MHALLAILLFALAPVQRPSDIVQWSAASSGLAAPGGTANIALTARIQDGWKLYALTQPKDGPQELSVAIGAGSPLTLDKKAITGPAPKTMKDENFGVATRYYEKTATFTVPVTVPKSAAGSMAVPLEVTFQACGAELCLRPFTQKLSVEIRVAR